MKILEIASCFLLLVALDGCRLGPNYARPVVDAPGSFRGRAPESEKTVAANLPSSAVAASLGAPVAAASLGDEKWWALFQDEQLQTLIRTALANNYDARLAAERVIAARAQLGITHADQLPTLSASGDINSLRAEETSVSPVFRAESGQLALFAAWELDFWGKYRKATEAARADLTASEWGQKAVTRTLVSNVASAYFQLRTLDHELEITQEALKSRQESLRLTKALADGGSAPLMDVRQAEQLVYAASTQIPSLEKQIEQQENYLSILLGKNPGPIARGLKLTEQPLLPDIPAGLPSELIERRPDIRQAEEQLIAASARIGVAKAAYFPSISLTGAGGFQSTALTSLFSGPAGLWSTGISAVQPIFEGGRIRNNVRLAESQQRQVLLVYRQTTQSAFRDISDALVAYRKSREAREQQQLLSAAAQDAARLSHIRYDAGATSYLEVLTNETNYYNAELNLSQARFSEVLTLVQIYNALGGGWQ
ncbi:MAG: efflux transporter outer membrane subunit [Terracidiphilus sp.]|nr:efflux transporter outer membrane subunit [Terracidiphilus sp.]